MTLLLALALAAASPARPLAVDDLVRVPRVADPAISPDGALVAFTVAQATADLAATESALWVVPAKGGAPRRLTHAKEKVSGPRFSPDGARLAFVSTRSGSPQIHVVDVAGGEPRQVTALPAGADAALWARGGSALVVLADVDPACGADLACNARKEAEAKDAPRLATRLLHRHWDTWRERLRAHLLLFPSASATGGAPTDLTPGDRDVPPWHRGGVDDLALSADGAAILAPSIVDAVEATSTNAELFALPLAGGEARRLTTNPGWDGSPRVSPDGRRLAWRSQARNGAESDRFRLLVGGPDASAPRDLTAGLDAAVDEHVWASPATLVFTADERGLRNVYAADAVTGAVRRLLEGANLSHLSASKDGRVVAGLVDGLTRPPEVAVLEGGKLRVLTRFGEEFLAGVAWGTARQVTAPSKDGSPVPGWIVTPAGARPGEPRPAVVLVHGGPQGAWNDAWSFRWNPMLWAARGWTVVLPNPRGSSGHGMAWLDAVRADWGGRPFEDVMAFTDGAVASRDADPARMCAAGASYGGYMVNFINGQTDRFRCLVSHAGDFDLEAAYYDTEELWFPEWELGVPWQRGDLYRRFSPRTYVTRWRTPTLVTHGELDYRVNVAQGYSTFTALQRLGVESRLLVFPDEGHWILRPKNSKRFHDVVFAWIADHLGADAPRTASARNR